MIEGLLAERATEGVGKYPNIAQYRDYREFLQAVYQDLERKNPRFSVRAFAKKLDLSPPMVLALFNRSRGLSLDRLLHVARCLQLSHPERKYLKLLYERSLVKSEADLMRIDAALAELAWRLTDEVAIHPRPLGFSPDWYHLALFEWAKRDPNLTVADLVAVGTRMGLTDERARLAIEDLIAAELLRRESTQITRQANRIVLRADEDREAVGRLHREMAEQALRALSEHRGSLPFSATEFVTLDAEGLSAVRAHAAKFLDRVRYEAAKASRRDPLYCFSLHLFPILGL